MMDYETAPKPATLLGLDEPAAVETINADGGGNAVLVCDHASNRVPDRLGTLGLEPALLADHIGWDPGAALVARRLAVHLDSPLVLSGYSRLVIDCNRPLGNEESIPEHSAGVRVPDNRGLSLKQREARIEALFRPHHGEREAYGVAPHSFLRPPGVLTAPFVSSRDASSAARRCHAARWRPSPRPA